MQINKKVQIGIRALTELRKRIEPISAQDLAKEIQTTTGFLEQIMRGLRKSELVIVKRGPGGGYTFNSERDPMTAFDVAMALDADFAPFTSRNNPDPSERVNGEIIDAFLRTRI